MPTFFTYVDWTLEEVSRPFYIGKGQQDRVNNPKRNIVHKNIRNVYGMRREVVFETFVEQEAFDKEVELIQVHRTHIYTHGWGANLTLGGDGASGFKQSAEHIEKRAAKKRGSKVSEETKQLIRMKVVGYKHTDEARMKMSLALRGRKHGPMSEELKAKLRAINKGAKRSHEFGLQCSARLLLKHHRRGKHLSDEMRQRISKSLTGRIQSQETIAKRVIKLTGKVKTQAAKDKQSASMKIAWARRKAIKLLEALTSCSFD